MVIRKKEIIVRLVLVVAVIVLFSLFIWRYTVINKLYSDTVKKQYQVMESGFFQDNVEMKVVDYQWMDRKKLIAEYGECEKEFENQDLRTLFVTVNFRNTGSKEACVESYNCYLETQGYANGISREVFLNCNKSDIMFSLSGGEQITLLLPFTIFEEQFTAREWKEIEKRKFYIISSLYPVKTIWDITS